VSRVLTAVAGAILGVVLMATTTWATFTIYGWPP
jgi:hypothetical protein